MDRPTRELGNPPPAAPLAATEPLGPTPREAFHRRLQTQRRKSGSPPPIHGPRPTSEDPHPQRAEMTDDRTEIQDDQAFHEAAQLSLERTRPPADVPGYDIQRFLGAGAYGEVWVAIDRNTGRQLAIKFYSHRGGLDWSLLSREVEKLVFLSADRYVVQLLDVGWTSDPPYYVMEYIERGSLDDYLRKNGSLAPAEALAIFREVTIGLVHAHSKGVLHCDLKPANVLLDQDNKPRIADFGQSRLSHEQDPALGTLFYMAPEQADLKAVPDARWDVYALGSLLYAMLTGAPPHRNRESIAEIETASDLPDRLARYRRVIVDAPHPTRRNRPAGIDRDLGEILDRCLEADPRRRWPSPHAVREALEAREARRARRPLLVLGALGPLLLMLTMFLFANRALKTAISKSDEALTSRALESQQFAARYVAQAAGGELEHRFRAVEEVVLDPSFQDLVATALADEELAELRAQLNDPALDEATLAPLREQLRSHPTLAPLRAKVHELIADPRMPDVASWFINDPRGLQIVRAPKSDTIARNYGWRTYFHGGTDDRPPNWRPGPDDHAQSTTLSKVFRSQATGHWIAGISTPIYAGGTSDGKFLGMIALTVEVGQFVEMQSGREQVAVLIDNRPGENQGLILQHPLYNQLGKVPERFKYYRVREEQLPRDDHQAKAHYRDPFAEDEVGADYAGRWLAEAAPVLVRSEPSGLYVIVQETHTHAIGPTLSELGNSLGRIGWIAIGTSIVVVLILWTFVVRWLMAAGRRVAAPADATATTKPADTMATIVSRGDS